MRDRRPSATDHGQKALSIPLADLRLPFQPPLRAVLIGGVFALEVLFCLVLLRVELLAIGDGIDSIRALSLQGAAIGEAMPASSQMSVPLPYHCPTNAAVGVCTLVLHIGGDRSAAPLPQAIYIPSYRGGLRVLLNGALVADSRWEQSPVYLAQPAPLLVLLPQAVLRSDANRIVLELTPHPGLGGFLGVVQIGPASLLRVHASSIRALVVNLPLLIDAALMTCGILVLIVWLLRPWDKVYLLFGVILLSLSAPSLPTIFVDPSLDPLWRLTNPVRLVAGSLILPFAWFFNGCRPPVPIALFLLPACSVIAINLWFPDAPLAQSVARGIPAVTAVLALAGIVSLLRAAWLGLSDAAMLLIGTMAIIFAFSIGDLLMVVVNPSGSPRMLLFRHIAALLIVVLSAILLWRFVVTLRLQEQFNWQLQRAVTEMETHLRASFAREQAQAQQVALQQERSRLMRDLHDGISGQLVSIQSLSETGDRAALDRIVLASRTALNDLRLVVASMQDVGDDLGLVLGSFRERIEPQIRAAGMELHWHVRSLPTLPGLHPTAMLHLYRILQEAVTNAIRHSGSPKVHILAQPSPHPGYGVRVSVCDDGHGQAICRLDGQGLLNMRKRAEAIGAAFGIHSDRSGTCVQLDLPLHLQEILRPP